MHLSSLKRESTERDLSATSAVEQIFGTAAEGLKMDLGINLSFNNLLNETYISHLSVLKADMIPNPGRNMVLGLNFKFL